MLDPINPQLGNWAAPLPPKSRAIRSAFEIGMASKSVTAMPVRGHIYMVMLPHDVRIGFDRCGGEIGKCRGNRNTLGSDPGGEARPKTGRAHHRRVDPSTVRTLSMVTSLQLPSAYQRYLQSRS
jgi:hypothetical protein